MPERLPPLRQDLELLEAPEGHDGAPTWTIHDPARNAFFRIGRAAFLLLSHWHLETPQAVIEQVKATTTAQVGPRQMAQLLNFLNANQLIEVAGPQACADHLQRRQAQRGSVWRWLLHRYLFFRIPLVRPDAFLGATLSWVRPLMTRGFVRLCVVLGVVGVLLTLRQWESFTHTFVDFLTWQGLAWFLLTLAVTKVLHELAHGYVAKAYGCRVTAMGVAFLVFYPVLYTDATDAWRLVSRRQRLLVGAAGMIAEVMLALLATFAWSFLPDGPLRSGAFLLATVTWTMTLLVNLNPFMRFDGYYLLSDWLGIQNLQTRGFALGRWRLREVLFGFGEPPPERLAPRLTNALLLYAYATWIWRFFLFLAIAVVVYHFFFKLLGLFLMTVELAWFIGRPIANELVQWWRRRQQMRLNRNTILTGCALAALIAFLVWPWQSRVEVPAVLQAGAHTTLFPPTPARIAEIEAQRGQTVERGEVLYRLDSPELEHKLAQTRRRIALNEALLLRQAASTETLERVQVLQSELAADRTRLEGLRQQQERLTVRAPRGGVLVDLPYTLAAGQWLGVEQRLGRIVAAGGAQLRGYVRGADLTRFADGARGRFYPDDPARPAFDVRVSGREAVNAGRLEIAYLAASYGGQIDVERKRAQDAEAQIAGTGLVPQEPVYRVSLSPTADVTAPQQVVRGTAMIDGEARSLVGRLWRTVAAVAIRESGF